MPRPRAAGASASRKPKQAPGLSTSTSRPPLPESRSTRHDPVLRAGDQRDRAPIDLLLKDVRHAPGVDRSPEVGEIGPLPGSRRRNSIPGGGAISVEISSSRRRSSRTVLCAREEKAPDGSGHPNHGPGSSADRASPPKPFLDLLHPAVQHRRARLRRRSQGLPCGLVLRTISARSFTESGPRSVQMSSESST
mgnify:CR=1 FL=1